MAQNRDSVSVANDPGDGDLHARLLAEIERREGMHKATLPMRDIVDRHQDSESLAYLAALRKVAEIHRDWPSTIAYADGSVIEARECRMCIDGECGEICRTLRTVAEALGVDVG